MIAINSPPPIAAKSTYPTATATYNQTNFTAYLGGVFISSVCCLVSRPQTPSMALIASFFLISNSRLRGDIVLSRFSMSLLGNTCFQKT